MAFKILAMFSLSRQSIIASKYQIRTGLCVINKQACVENYLNILRVVKFSISLFTYMSVVRTTTTYLPIRLQNFNSLSSAYRKKIVSFSIFIKLLLCKNHISRSVELFFFFQNFYARRSANVINVISVSPVFTIKFFDNIQTF